MPRLRGLMGLCAPSSNISTLWLEPLRPKGEDSQATLRITTLTLAPEGSHRPLGVLVNAALHYKHNAPNGGIVFQRVPIERNDVRLKAGEDRANLIAQPGASAPSSWQRPSRPWGPNRSHACDR